MRDTLKWRVHGESFEDGSTLSDWVKIDQGDRWHWQYDTHELTFDIYEHDGQYWKLYRVRFVPEGEQAYQFDYGGQACRMTLVRYLRSAKSPHSSKLMKAGSTEWVRTYEVDTGLHAIVKSGRRDPKYDRPNELDRQSELNRTKNSGRSSAA